MKIVKFVADNLKRLRAVTIDPKGNIVQISGPNGAGKSSVLDAIFWTLSGNKNVQKQPVRHGASEGHSELDLGDITVKKKFSKTGATVVVERKSDGVRIEKPQAFLDSLCGKGIGFDPLAFSRMKPKDQFEQLRGLVKLEIDINKLDELNRSDYSKRTDINRDIKNLRGQFDGLMTKPGLPEGFIDISELTAKVESAATHNKEIEIEKSRRAAFDEKIVVEQDNVDVNASAIKNIQDNIKALSEKILQIEADTERRQSKIVAMKAERDAKPPIPAPIDVSDVRKQINEAVSTNNEIGRRDQQRKVGEKIADAEKKVEELTAAMEGREKTKRDAIAATKFPVEGLGFGSDEVLLGGVPFEQASSAEQLRASCAIAMAMNPELRVIIIRDGSLLDERSLAILGELAKDNDYQVWMEVVDTSGTVGVVLEDGMVAADNQKTE